MKAGNRKIINRQQMKCNQVARYFKPRLYAKWLHIWNGPICASTNFNSLWDALVGTRFRMHDEITSSQPISWVPERSHHGCHNDEGPMKRTSRGPFHFRPFAPIFTKQQDGNRTPNLLPERPRSMQRSNPLNSLLERSVQLLTERTLRDFGVETRRWRLNQHLIPIRWVGGGSS